MTKTSKNKYISQSWEKDLNPDQRKAVEKINGPLMVLAGAGSGKTRVIAYRIAYIVANHAARADKIMSLTFTNKAAGEMKKRAAKLIDSGELPLWIGTFHSIFSRILRREAAKIGFTNRFSIYDTVDQERAVKDVIIGKNLRTGNLKPKDFLQAISSLKSRLITHTAYEKSEFPDEKYDILAPVYTAYTNYLKKCNAMDFDDLLMYTYFLFKNNAQVLKSYQNKFKYILVDEFQDTNRAQYQILLQLADLHQNICVVGDDDQSIYSWRGAEIKNILQFEHDFDNTTIVKLEQNYRSTKNILNAANSIIKNNQIRHVKKLWTDKPQGEKVTLNITETDREEAEWVGNSIQSSVIKDNRGWGDFAILYRMNAQSRVLEDYLRRAAIPYAIIGGLKFYERKEVKDVLAYLCLLVNSDDSVSLKRVINYPARGIGKLTVQKIEQFATAKDISLFNALKLVSEVNSIPKKRVESVLEFYKLISKYRKLRTKVSMVELVSSFIEEIKIFQQLQTDSARESIDRIQNVNELLRAIDEYAAMSPGNTIEGYLSEIALITDIDAWDDSQQLRQRAWNFRLYL
jgi:DNA helicase-2/ATP-dependent DNA helicase PcrA